VVTGLVVMLWAMADLLVVAGIVVFMVAMLAVIRGLELARNTGSPDRSA
jgi:hypothetical protein